MIQIKAVSRIRDIREKVASGQRLSFEDGIDLAESDDLFTIGELANMVREKKNGNVTYSTSMNT